MNPLLLARQEWPKMLVGAGASVVLAVASGLLPLLCIAPFLESLATNNLQKAPGFLAIGAGLVFLAAVALFVQDMMFGLAGADFGWRSRKEIYSALLNHSLDFSPNNAEAQKSSGGLVGRIVSDLGELTHFFANELGFLTGQAFTILFSLVLLVVTNVKLTLLLLVVMLPVAFVLFLLGKTVEKTFKTSQDALELASGNMAEGLSRLEIAKAFSLQEILLSRFQKANSQQLRAAKNRVWLSSTHWPVSQVSIFLGIGLVLLFALYLINIGQFNGRSLISYLTLVGMAIGPLQIFSRFVPRWFAMRVPAQTLWEAMQLAPEPDEGNFSAGATRGEIVFKNVSAQYAAASQQATLSDISFNIPAGGSLALVGSSGGGKSTVLRLLLRFLPCSQGNIFLDNTDIQNYSLASLRSAIAFVPQQAMLFSGSLRENLLLVKPQASESEIWNAIELAGLTEEIRAMPLGLETMLGENASGISGGQAQRLAIARALMTGAKVLVLDEPTSALDAWSEAAIKKTLIQLRGNHTVVVIAHRLSTVDSVDHIVVLQNGCVIESGTPTELQHAAGAYAALLAAGKS